VRSGLVVVQGERSAMQLNPQQVQVAEHVHGRILTLAGPGSGKTRTLTESAPAGSSARA
jgi:hypothetical protein